MEFLWHPFWDKEAMILAHKILKVYLLCHYSTQCTPKWVLLTRNREINMPLPSQVLQTDTFSSTRSPSVSDTGLPSGQLHVHTWLNWSPHFSLYYKKYASYYIVCWVLLSPGSFACVCIVSICSNAFPLLYWDHYAKLITAGHFKISSSLFSLSHCVSVYLSISMFSASQNQLSFVDMTVIIPKQLRHSSDFILAKNKTGQCKRKKSTRKDTCLQKLNKYPLYKHIVHCTVQYMGMVILYIMYWHADLCNSLFRK